MSTTLYDFFGDTTGSDAVEIIVHDKAELSKVENALAENNFEQLHALGYARKDVYEYDYDDRPIRGAYVLDEEKVARLRERANRTPRDVVRESLLFDQRWQGPASRSQAFEDEINRLLAQ